jgi:hypothetical protein
MTPVTDAQILEGLARIDRRRRLFPPGARCRCGEVNPLAFVRARRPIVCLECDATRRNVSPLQEHHVGGRPSPLRILLPCNLHATATFAQDVLWRGRTAPGSILAIRIDLAVLETLLTLVIEGEPS